MREAYIVTAIRTPGCKRAKGAFKDTRPEDLLSFILKEAVARTPNLERQAVESLRHRRNEGYREETAKCDRNTKQSEHNGTVSSPGPQQRHTGHGVDQ